MTERLLTAREVAVGWGVPSRRGTRTHSHESRLLAKHTLKTGEGVLDA
jgi:hypothetical protein